MFKPHVFHYPEERCRLCGNGGIRSSFDPSICTYCRNVATAADARACSRIGIQSDMKASGIPLRSNVHGSGRQENTQ